MYMHTIIEFIKISIKKYMYQNIEKKYNKQLKNHFFLYLLLNTYQGIEIKFDLF